MKILIIGAGALGSYFGGSLQKSGNDVTLVCRNREHREAILSNGLCLEKNGETEKVSIDCISEIDLKNLNPDFEMVFIFTKSKDTYDALTSSEKLIKKSTTLISLQNGIGNEEILQHFSEKVIYGCTTLPSDLKGPGFVSSSGTHITNFNSISTADNKLVLDLRNILNGCGIYSEISANISEAIWKKAIFNSAVNVICALIQGTPGEIAKSNELINLANNVANEGCEVAQNWGIKVNTKEVKRIITMSTVEHPNHKPSMLVDILNKKKTEIESITGQIVRFGEKGNVQTPYNNVLYSLIKALEK
ncbi:MAG: ketopantoate reductase family protein [Paracoccaceae bacterium]